MRVAKPLKATGMIDALFNQTTYAAAKKMLDATALRQQAIASNMANLETPGYRRLEVARSFQEELSRALQEGTSTTIGQIRPQLVQDPAVTRCRRDGNNVQLETELLALNRNTLAHAVETQLITGKLLQLRLAISGRAI